MLATSHLCLQVWVSAEGARSCLDVGRIKERSDGSASTTPNCGVRPHPLADQACGLDPPTPAGTRRLAPWNLPQRKPTKRKRWSRPVSRVLYVLRRDSHSSRPGVATWLQRPTRE